MKADTAAVRIVDGVGEEVIEIDEHGSQHDQSCFAPVFFPEQSGEQKGDYEVKPIVDDVSEYFGSGLHGLFRGWAIPDKQEYTADTSRNPESVG